MSANGSLSIWRERLTSPLTWHLAGFALLLVLTAGLAIRLGMDASAMHSSSSDVLANKQTQLQALEIQTAPLRGLDQRVDKTRAEVATFYKKRIPADYSSISTRFGGLAVGSGVRLTRVQYSQAKPDSGLTEISMDASISGDYPSIMRFVNGLERDQIFFIVRAMTLTSQQGGLVNLRLRVSTWLRPAAAAASGLPATPDPNDPDAAAQSGKEGE
ncbi:MAG: GspMb/PilO family protein [Terracidiphilus sp.]